MSIELKIKSKHLALEPAIIRHEERKLKAYNKRKGINSSYKLNSLIEHRRWNVRNESRATNLARAFIAGKTYATVERNCKNCGLRYTYILPRVVAMVQKYKDRKVTTETIMNWITAE